MKKDKKPGGDYVRKVAEDAHHYLRELLDENERLRAQLTQLRLAEEARRHLASPEEGLHAKEKELSQTQDLLRSTQRQLESWERRHAALEQQLTELVGENRHYSDRFFALEREASKLSSLYVASYRLHETLDRQGVIQVIEEVVTAIIGSEELAIFEMNGDRTALSLVRSMGLDPSGLRAIPLGEGFIGRAVNEGETYVAQDGQGGPTLPREQGLTACVPLRLGQRVTGAIAIFQLLPQKTAYEPVDHALFELLGTHAAMALYFTRLHEQATA